ncbi:SRPBCC family protein [Streptomyces sp. NBC_00690]|uniref:SRPBCC family protein n=1 Tax=Streptomyces sp. NBC_00690 TaxID=2975808 RepID=UPI002E2D767D|nr:SRPBCC family protein [Streptomyces sp. NBC_00690]
MNTTARPGMPTTALVSRRGVVAATPSVIFALLAAPGEHPGLDGTGEVQSVIEGPQRLELGSVFRMRMKGYMTANTVVEFEHDALIAWRHRGRHVWRWQLRAVPGGTEVTETFDYTAKRARRLVRLIGIPKRAGTAMDKTLTALQARFA